MATDRSFKNIKGSYALILSCREDKLQIEGLVYGRPLLTNSFQVELTGILAIYLLLLTFMNFTGRTMEVPPPLYCNNLYGVMTMGQFAAEKDIF
eukprot:8349878-Ditylum_brightwellii.AAC.1